MADLTSDDERLIVGIGSSEDAGVFRLDSDRALVQTLDVITPVVDDPYLYGQIAAANSLSDVFAMGAKVLTAMNIVGFDGCNHPQDVLAEILAGGASKVKECGGVVVGGHTIEAPEMTYGLSVTGLVDPKKIYRNDTPRVGDMLVLTKPLGMGVLTTAIKADLLAIEKIKSIANTLAQLNYKASLIMQEFNVSACTDVTGFGLAGHAYEMSGKGRVSLSFEFNKLPIIPEALDMAMMGIIPAGTYNNRSYLFNKTEWKIETPDEILFYDAQTSGGLLIAVSQKDAQSLVKRLREEGYEEAVIIAEVLPPNPKPLIVC